MACSMKCFGMGVIPTSHSQYYIIVLHSDYHYDTHPPSLAYPTLAYPCLPYPCYPCLPYPCLPLPALAYPTLAYPCLPLPTLAYPYYLLICIANDVYGSTWEHE